MKEVKQLPPLTGQKVAYYVKEMFDKKISGRIIQRTLNRVKLKSCSVVCKPLISKKNLTQRMKFARYHINKDQKFWDNILWSDESKFNVFQADGRKRVCRLPNQAFKRQNLKPTVKHGGGSVMVWGCMASNGVRNIQFLEGIMDQFKYQSILDRNVKISETKLGLGRKFTFQQDSNPKHSASLLWNILRKTKY